METVDGKVDYRLLNAISNMVLCSPCFQSGRTTPVPQLISHRHQISNVCKNCQTETLPTRGETSPQRRRLIEAYLKL